MGAIKEIKKFTGGMNQDLDPRFIPDGDYISAQNMLIGVSEGSNVGDAEGILGNSKIDMPVFGDPDYKFWTPHESDQIIGHVEYIRNDSILYFVYNPVLTVGHGIFEYNINTRAIRGIMRSANLNFDINYPVLDADILETKLYWTDGLNPPRSIDIEKAHLTTTGQPDGYTSFTEEVLNMAKKPPTRRPEVEFVDDATLTVNLLTEDTFKFRYSYIYYDDQRSSMSPISEVPVRDRQVNTGTWDNILMQNKIEVTVDLGTLDLVKYVVLYVQKNNGEWAEFARSKRDLFPFQNQNTYDFIGNEARTFVETAYSDKNYDPVPLVAKTQQFIGQTYLAYANLKEFYEVEDNSDITYGFIGINIPAPFDGLDVTNYINKTFKRRGKYKVGYKYKDEYGRESGVLGVKDISVPRHLADQNVDTTVDLYKKYILNTYISHKPPSWAKTCHICITENSETLNYTQFVDYGVAFKIKGDDKTVEFNKAINYDIQKGDEIRIIHRFVPTGSTAVTTIDYLDQNGEGNSMIVSKVEGTKIYVETNADIDIIYNHLYLIEVSTPKKEFDDKQFYEIGPAIDIKQDGSGNYYHDTPDIQQLFHPNGNLIQAGQILIDEGDTYIEIGKIDSTLSSEGRLHRIVLGTPATPTPNDLPRIEISPIDINVPTGEWSPLDDMGTYFPTTGALLKWTGVAKDSFNKILIDGTRTFDPYYAIDISEFTFWLNNPDPSVAFQPEDPLSAFFEYELELYWVIERKNQYKTQNDFTGNDYGRLGILNQDENYREFEIAKIRYSGRAFEGTKVNRLNEFSFDDIEYLEEQYGEIVRMVVLGDTLKLFQNRKVTSIYLNRSEKQSLDGGTELTYSNKLLGSKRPSVTRFGCYHPESVIVTTNSIYFFDVLNSKYLASGQSGIMEISDAGMQSYFRDWSDTITDDGFDSAQVYSAWDQRHEMLIVHITNERSRKEKFRSETLAYSERDKRWKTFLTFSPDWMSWSGTEFLTAKGKDLWIHHEGVHGAFYDAKSPFRIKMSFNEGGSRKKIYHNIRVSSNKRVAIPEITSEEKYLSNVSGDYEYIVESKLLRSDFENVDGAWVTYFKKNMNTPGFPNQELALINGDELIMECMILTLEYDQSDEIIINEVLVEANETPYNY